MFAINYNGLRRKPNYDELIDYIQNGQDKIKYPNRAATFVANSNQYQQFIGQSLSDLQDQEMRLSQHKIQQETLRQEGYRGPHVSYIGTPGSVRTPHTPFGYYQGEEPPSSGVLTPGDYMEGVDEEVEQRDVRSQYAASTLIRGMQGDLDEQTRGQYQPLGMTAPVVAESGSSTSRSRSARGGGASPMDVEELQDLQRDVKDKPIAPKVKEYMKALESVVYRKQPMEIDEVEKRREAMMDEVSAKRFKPIDDKVAEYMSALENIAYQKMAVDPKQEKRGPPETVPGPKMKAAKVGGGDPEAEHEPKGPRGRPPSRARSSLPAPPEQEHPRRERSRPPSGAAASSSGAAASSSETAAARARAKSLDPSYQTVPEDKSIDITHWGNDEEGRGKSKGYIINQLVLYHNFRPDAKEQKRLMRLKKDVLVDMIIKANLEKSGKK